jgi:hypothetical protein
VIKYWPVEHSRRQFLKLGALFVPAAAAVAIAPRVAYSFIWAKPKIAGRIYRAHEFELLFNGVPIEHDASDFIIIDKDGHSGSLSRRLPPQGHGFGNLLITIKS